jgi:subtilase family serine protease
VSSLAIAQEPQQRRIVRPIDNASAVRLRGSLPPRARADLDRGPVAAAMPMQSMTIFFSRTPSQQAALDQLLAEQHDQSSTNYHKWLTPEEFGDRFGLADEDVKLVAGWLITQGFTVTEIARSRTWVSFSGNASQVAAAFQTPIHNFLVDGVVHYAPSTEAAVPSALSNVVTGITGLDDFRPRLHSHARHVNPQLTSSISGNHFVVPGDFGTIYNLPDYVNGVFQSGNDGNGQVIGIVGQTSGTGTTTVTIGTITSDVSTFRSLSGLPSGNLNTVPLGNPTQFSTGEAEEAALDIEWSGAVAPNASIIFAYSPNALTTSLQYLVNQGGAAIQVISISFGDCESDFSGQIPSTELMLSQANAQGQSVFAAAGDNGATDCDGTAQNPVATSTQGLAVDYPASSIYVTGMGGTEFTGDSTATVSNGAAAAQQYWNGSSNVNDTSASAFSYIPEIVWNDTASTSTNVGTGGGVSKRFSKPFWQTGSGVPADGQRDVPDVSLASSPNHDGYIICSQGECQTGYRRNSDQTYTVIGGTSAASPGFAGIAALINQKLGGRQGNLNPQIYTFASSSSWAFNDITNGDNKVVCTVGTTDCSSSPIGFTAGTGYDLVTGWGTVDVTALLNAFNGTPNPHFVLLPNSRNVSLNPGANSVIAVSVTPKEGFSGSVALTCNPSSTLSGVSCSYDNANVATPGSANLTIQAGSSTIAQTGTVTLQGNNTASVAINVSVGSSDFSLTVASPVVSISSGGTITDNLTVAGTGTFNSDVALTCSVPSSLGTTTCTISPATVTGGSGTALVTLKGAVLSKDRGAPLPFQHRGLGTYATFVFALGMVFAGNPLRSRRARRALRNGLLGLFLLAIAFGAVSCGGGGSGGSTGTTPTPLNGNVTITATSGSITHTTTINVTVQ